MTLWMLGLLAVWLESQSVALPRWGFGMQLNPAVAGADAPMMSAWGSPGRSGVAVGGWGMGVWVEGDPNGPSFRYGLPVSLGNEALRVGYALEGGEGRTWFRGGLRVRPRAWLSLGGMVRVGTADSFRVGAAVRPVGPLTFTLDAYGATRGTVRVEGGLLLRLLPGLEVGAFGDSVARLRYGFAATVPGLPYLRVGGLRRADGTWEAALAWSRVPFPSAWNPRPKVRWTVDRAFPELPRRRWFLDRAPSFTEWIQALRAYRDRPPTVLWLRVRRWGWTLAQTEEVRAWLDTLRRRGTEIWISSGYYSLKGLYLASVADRVFLTPEGSVVVPGLLSEGLYLKALLDRLGIQVEADRFSEYKSAVEPLTRTSMSPEDSLQRAVLLQDFWATLLPPVAQRMGLPEDSLAALLLSHVYFTADEALAAGLVDELRYDDEVDSLFRRAPGRTVTLRPKPHPVHREAWRDRRPVVAVVVVDGVIAQGPSAPPSPWPLPLLGDRVAGSWTYQQIFRRLRADRSVRAVVVRIHSPGGDAFASEEIWREIERTARAKPVVISMAGVAASGGYYIAMGARTVLADALTVTGSIGILNLRLVLRGFYEKLGVRKDRVQLGEHADVFSDWRALTEEERAAMHHILEKGYETFLLRVARGRGMSRDAVEALARGRIWSGDRAARLGLVDRIGGVMAAVEEAARQAHLKAYRIRVVPVEGSRFPFPMDPLSLRTLRQRWETMGGVRPVYLDLRFWDGG